MSTWWKAHWKVISIIALIVFIVFIIAAYKFNWNWTGFNGGYPKITAKGNTKESEQSPAKNLWDWLQLLGVLAIPAAVSFGTLWFTTHQNKTRDAENEDNQRESTLQDYFDKMSELLLKENLRGNILTFSVDSKFLKGGELKSGDEVRTVARARTLTVLSRLDGRRKGSLLQFLYESHLLEKDKPIVFLHGANLSRADLSEAYLSEADLSGAYLFGAYLSEADLSGANLNGANLFEACLSGAKLSGAKLSGANLSGANLSGANLSGANLSKVDLSEANLSGANLSGANLFVASLFGANLSGANLSGANLKDAIDTTTKRVYIKAKRSHSDEGSERIIVLTNRKN
jgi:flagellar basal body-associated protein FliL